MTNRFSLPFENIITINHSGILNVEELVEATEKYIGKGVCLLLKETTSNELEGGYLFNFIKNPDDSLDVFSIHKRKMVSFSTFNKLEEFINHHSGRKFNKEQWLISQQLNYLLFNEEISPH